MPLGYQVYLIQSNPVFNEFKVVPIHTSGVGDTFSHAKASFHICDALWTNAANGITLIGADPFVVPARQSFKQTVKIVSNDW